MIPWTKRASRFGVYHCYCTASNNATGITVFEQRPLEPPSKCSSGTCAKMLLVRTGSSSQRLDEALPTSPVNPTAIMYETYGIRGRPRGCCRCSRNRTGFCRGSRRGAAPWQLTPSSLLLKGGGSSLNSRVRIIRSCCCRSRWPRLCPQLLSPAGFCLWREVRACATSDPGSSSVSSPAS